MIQGVDHDVGQDSRHCVGHKVEQDGRHDVEEADGEMTMYMQKDGDITRDMKRTFHRAGQGFEERHHLGPYIYIGNNKLIRKT